MPVFAVTAAASSPGRPNTSTSLSLYPDGAYESGYEGSYSGDFEEGGSQSESRGAAGAGGSQPVDDRRIARGGSLTLYQDATENDLSSPTRCTSRTARFTGVST